MENFVNIVESDHGKQVQFLDGRYYTVDGNSFFPGITTILSVVDKGAQYKKWLQANGFNADVLARDAMNQGSNVHEAIQKLLNGEEVIFGNASKMFYTRNEWVMISRFIDFYTEFKPRTVSVEQVFVSDTLGFGSQLDYICELNGALVYVDHKTGNLYDSSNLQLAAGIQLWNEHNPQNPITKGAILHLDSTHRGRDKSGKKMQGQGWQLVEVEDLDRHWSDFQAIQQIWKRQNPSYVPFNLIFPASYQL